jgi:hypothetical protein
MRRKKEIPHPNSTKYLPKTPIKQVSRNPSPLLHVKKFVKSSFVRILNANTFQS